MSYKILAVDDSLLVRSQLQAILEKYGWETILAGDAMEAIRILKDNHPDIIITDIEMPKIDGIQFIQWLRARQEFRNTPVLVLSGINSRAKMHQSLHAGADDYIAKPIEEIEIISRVRAIVRALDLVRDLGKKNTELAKAFEIIEDAYRDSVQVGNDIRIKKERLDDELRSVGEIQKQLLTHLFPVNAEWEFAVFYQPSGEAGGDYYDLIELDNGQWSVFIGDVSGHGAYAAVVMAMAKILAEESSRLLNDPAAILTKIDSSLFRNTSDSCFMTMSCCYINPKTGEMVYSAAGHHPALYYHQNLRTVEALPQINSYPLSLIEGSDYHNQSIIIQPGDAIVLYTDGIVEARNPNKMYYGVNRFCHKLQEVLDNRLELAIPELIHDIRHFIEGENFSDDLTLFIIRRKLQTGI